MWQEHLCRKMAKRKLEEFDASPVNNAQKAIVHGVVTKLSPVKKNKRDEKVKYFNGQLADDKGCVREVYIHPSLRQAKHDSLTKQATSIVDCQVKEAWDMGSEVWINQLIKIETSPINFIHLQWELPKQTMSYFMILPLLLWINLLQSW